MEFELLSKREHSVVELTVRGLIDKEICRELSITANTLRTYWRRVREKLGDHTRSRIAAEYVAAGLLPQLHSESPSGWPGGAPASASGWVRDLRTDMTWASDSINRRLQLEVGVPHPGRIYDATLHPDDYEHVNHAWRVAVENHMSEVTFTHRTLVRSVTTTHYSFVEIEYDGDTPVLLRGHTVTVDSPVLLARVLVGFWQLPTQADDVRVDAACCEILGLRSEAKVPYSTLEAALVEADRSPLQQCLGRLRARSSDMERLTVRVRRSPDALLYAQLYARSDAEEAAISGSLVALV